jgi:mevalonate kinase
MKAVAEAPAKVIITGEHFVVHGAWALAAALPRRVRAEAFEAPSLRVVSDRVPVRDKAAIRPALALVEAMAQRFSFSPRLGVSIHSEVPEGAGLGSSAATMVATAAAVAKLKSLRLTVDELISISMVGEKAVHGRPSGVDPTVCAIGGVVLFRPGRRPRKVALTGNRVLLISYSGVKRSTRRLIDRVSGARERFPALFTGLAEAVGESSLLSSRRLTDNDMKGLGRLLTYNHAVLSAVGASSSSLDGLVNLNLSLGAYGAKLTGAGGGGSVVAVAPKRKEKRVISGLKARGFETFRAEVPVEGVRSWLEP